MKHVIALGVLVALVTTASGQSSTGSVTYPAKAGPGKGRHVVLLTGDEEYRSEEGLPMLAKILSQRHGFKTTVLFSLDPDGTINPKNAASLSDPAALDSADAIIMLLRFRHWSDEDMARFEKRLNAGTPIIALRTSTHAFNGFEKGSRWESWNYNNQGGFGKRVLGETWLTHWGRHKVEATRGAIEDGAREHPVLRGVTDLFGDTDVYEAYPPPDSTILVRGVVLKELTPDSAPADYRKRRATDKQEQGVNDPPMPVVWTRHYKNDGGTTNRILTSTMGSATDLENEGLRRLIVNGVYWGLGLDVPARADVTYVDEYKPSFYGFDGFRKGLRPSDFELGKRVPGEPLPRPPRAPEAAPPTRLDQSNAGRWLWQRKRDLGAVVCHETIPGHHLEISLSLERPDAHLVTKPTGTSAFSEGWGLYAERLADEMKLYAGDVDRLGRWQSRAYRASRLVVATGLHAFGWPRQKAIDVMKALHLASDEEIASEIDRYIIWPGKATAFVTGAPEIERLRAAAEQRLGSRFGIRAFHDAVLVDGPVPLPVLRSRLETLR